MLEFSFSLDNSGKILTVREAVAIDTKTKDRILVSIKHNADGTFEATSKKYPTIKGIGVGLKGALAAFNKQYEEVTKSA